MIFETTKNYEKIKLTKVRILLLIMRMYVYQLISKIISKNVDSLQDNKIFKILNGFGCIMGWMENIVI